MLNRSVSTNIIDRLRDVVPGLSFNNVGNSQINIRGQSTIFGNAEPLIVIDNFPYDGDLLDINPNDVESITILRDAAAASIWGARAGNGVIVITSKKGKLNRPLQVSFSSNITVGNIPDLYAANRLSSADYIDIEKRLFTEGYYDDTYLTGYQPLTPVIELLYQKRADPSLATAIDAQVEALKELDVRDDFKEYLYQKNIYQQYNLNLNGGNNAHTYYLSAGFDKNRENLVNNNYKRISINAGNNFRMLNDKLELNTGINFFINRNQNNNSGIGITNSTAGNSIYPYAQLANGGGNPLSIVKNYRTSFIENAESNGLLNWSYSPLDEINYADNVSKRNNIRLNSAIKYQVLYGLSVSALYQYTGIQSTNRNFYSQETYFTRDLINRYTQVNGIAITRPIPLGGILDLSNQSVNNHTFRLQSDFDKTFSQKHTVSALAGYEVRDIKTTSNISRYYGYDAEHAQNGMVNYVNNTFPYYYDNSRSGSVPFMDDTGLFVDRYISYFGNGAYTFDNRLIASISARIDKSNLFGVNTNQKGVPLWSVGGSWILSNEGFYTSAILPFLKIRATLGYNGSVNKSVSAYTTAAFTGYAYGLPYATIINPPNPELRWERVKIINLGIDFATKNNRLSGSLEYYHKNGIDLIGDTPFPPSSGITLFRGNTANTSGNGFDLNISSKNITGKINWTTDLFLSHLSEKVTNYNVDATTYYYIQIGTYPPLKGKPLYAIYSYKWAGLDPSTGDPQGYLNGEVSKDYGDILATTTTDNMVFGGSVRPTNWGAVRNTVNYKTISLSFNIAYRLGYYFRKNSISYSNNYGLLSNNGDYALRWVNPGNEMNTIVPSIPAVADNNRDAFYRFSDVLVDKADNIRFQDIRISYSPGLSSLKKMPFTAVQLFALANNIGILWKATHFDVDPDNQGGNSPFSVSIGLKVNLK